QLVEVYREGQTNNDFPDDRKSVHSVHLGQGSSALVAAAGEIVLHDHFCLFRFYTVRVFQNKDVATQAILSRHNTEINGQIVKCSWGKETVDNGVLSAATPALVSAQLPYAYAAAAAAAAAGAAAGQQLTPTAGYWYNPLTAAYPQLTPTATAAAAGQFLQAYPYSQLNYHQAYAGLGLQPSLAAAWQPATLASQSPISLAAAAHGLQQQSVLSAAYPLQQFQAQ
ncbi:unnamed protein product, partial [Cyprideis torosa]